jgi:hypothetical protein
MRYLWIGRRAAGPAALAVAALLASPAAAQPGRGEQRADTGSIVGRVHDAESRPVESARVRDVRSGRLSLTDAEGRFNLTGLPAGPRSLEITAIGYTPALGDVEVRLGLRAELAVVLAPIATRLDSVLVVADADRSGAPREFLERVKLGHATRTFTVEEIERRHPFFTSSLLQLIPGVRVAGSGPRAAIVPGRSACARVYIDGYPVRSDEMNTVSPQMLAGLEYYEGANAPSQYARGTPCAVLLLWTKHPGDDKR